MKYGIKLFCTLEWTIINIENMISGCRLWALVYLRVPGTRPVDRFESPAFGVRIEFQNRSQRKGEQTRVFVLHVPPPHHHHRVTLLTAMGRRSNDYDALLTGPPVENGLNRRWCSGDRRSLFGGGGRMGIDESPTVTRFSNGQRTVSCAPVRPDAQTSVQTRPNRTRISLEPALVFTCARNRSRRILLIPVATASDGRRFKPAHLPHRRAIIAQKARSPDRLVSSPYCRLRTIATHDVASTGIHRRTYFGELRSRLFFADLTKHVYWLIVVPIRSRHSPVGLVRLRGTPHARHRKRFLGDEHGKKCWLLKKFVFFYIYINCRVKRAPTVYCYFTLTRFIVSCRIKPICLGTFRKLDGRRR